MVNDYWNPLLNLVREINEKHGQRALLFFIHGIGDGNADAQIPAPDIIVGKGFIPNPDDPKVGKYDAKAASASEMFFDELIDGIKDMGVVRDDVPNYQGSRRLPRHLYEERHNLKIDIEAVQLEFRNRGYRDTPENWSRRGQELAKAIQNMKSSFKSWSKEEVPAAAVQLISPEKFKAQVEDLRRATKISNDKGQEVNFEGEIKENFISLFQRAYPVVDRIMTGLNEAGPLLSEVHQVLKPQKLFLTWIRYTGIPERTAYNYLRVYQRFGSHLPELSYLGIKRLLIASSAPNCVDYVKNNEQTIAKEPAETLQKKVRELRGKKKKTGVGRPPKYEMVEGLKIRASDDGSKIVIEGLTKKSQKQILEGLKGLLSKGKK